MSILDILAGVAQKVPKAQRMLYGILKQEVYYRIESYVVANHGSKSDAEDKFHDAIIVLFSKIEKGSFKLNKNGISNPIYLIGGFLLAVTRNLWLKELRKRKKKPGPIVNPDIQPPEKLSAYFLESTQMLDSITQRIVWEFFIKKNSCTKISNSLDNQIKTEEVNKILKKGLEKLLEKISLDQRWKESGIIEKIIEDSLLDLQERCSRILHLFYKKGKNYEEIARLLDYSNGDSAKQQKSKCMHKLRILVVGKLFDLTKSVPYEN